MGLWKANGLAQHRQEIEVFLNDILLVSETHFTNRNYFSIHKYKTYHTQHPDATAHGGTAVIISEKIPHLDEEDLQATSIKIKDSSDSLTIAAIYCPPRHSVKKEQFEKFFDYLGSSINSKGRELHKTLSRRGYSHISTSKPIYWPTDTSKIPYLLDFFVTKRVSLNKVNVDPS